MPAKTKKVAKKKVTNKKTVKKPTLKKSKTLVVFYSLTGTTRKVAEEIKSKLNCDIEEIFDKKKRTGVTGYAGACKDAVMKSRTTIGGMKKDPKKYDRVIIGTPVWGWTMTPAVRTYLEDMKDGIKKVSFFCTMGGSGDNRTFTQMKEILGKEPENVLTLIDKDVKKDTHKDKLKKFTKELK